MKVRDVMTPSAVCRRAKTNVGAAVELLWSHNCGMLQVVGADNRLIGIVTDRDVCIAMGTWNRLPGELAMGQIAIGQVSTYKPDDGEPPAPLLLATAPTSRRPSDRGY